MIYRISLWVVIALTCSVTLFGFIKNPVLIRSYWAGAHNALVFVLFTGVYWLAAVFSYFTWRRHAPLIFTLAALFFVVSSVGIQALAAVLFILFSALCLGDLIFSRQISDRYESSIGIILMTLAGMAIYMTVIGYAVHVKVNYRAVYFAMLALPVVINWKKAAGYFRFQDISIYKTQNRLGEYLTLMLVLFVFFLHLIHVCRPETYHDAMATHLTVPHYVYVNHLWSFDFQNHIWAVMPMGGDWSYTIAYMLGGEYGARLINFSFFILTTILVTIICQRIVSKPTAYLLGALFGSSPLLHLENSSLFIENPQTALILGGVTAIMKFAEKGHNSDLYLVGLILGTALATKVMSGFMILFVCVLGVYSVIVWRDKMNVPKTLLISCLLFAITGFYPYVYAYSVTGNPVFPFFNSLFKSPYYEITQSFDNLAWKCPLTLTTLYDLTFHSNKYLESNSGVFGYHYLLILPLGILTIFKTRTLAAWTLILMATGYIVAIFQFQAYMRYLCPAFPLFIIFMAHIFSVVKTEDSYLFQTVTALSVFVVFMNLWNMPTSSWNYRELPIADIFLGKNHEKDIQYKAPERKISDYLNIRYGDSPRVGFMSRPYIAGFNGKAFTNNWYNNRFVIKMKKAVAVSDIADIVTDYDLTHFVTTEPDNHLSEPLKKYLKEFSEKEFEHGNAVLYRIEKKRVNKELLEKAPLQQKVLIKKKGWYADGWIGKLATATVKSDQKRMLIINGYLPAHGFTLLSWPEIKITLKIDGNVLLTRIFKKEENFSISKEIPPNTDGELTIECDKAYVPSKCGLNNDTRELSCVISQIYIQ